MIGDGLGSICMAQRKNALAAGGVKDHSQMVSTAIKTNESLNYFASHRCSGLTVRLFSSAAAPMENLNRNRTDCRARAKSEKWSKRRPHGDRTAKQKWIKSHFFSSFHRRGFEFNVFPLALIHLPFSVPPLSFARASSISNRYSSVFGFHGDATMAQTRLKIRDAFRGMSDVFVMELRMFRISVAILSVERYLRPSECCFSFPFYPPPPSLFVFDITAYNRPHNRPIEQIQLHAVHRWRYKWNKKRKKRKNAAAAAAAQARRHRYSKQPILNRSFDTLKWNERSTHKIIVSTVCRYS